MWTLTIAWAAALAWQPFRRFAQPGVCTIHDCLSVESPEGPYRFAIVRAWELRTWAYGWRRGSAPAPDSPPVHVAVSVYESPPIRTFPQPVGIIHPKRQTVFRIDLRDLRYEWQIPHVLIGPEGYLPGDGDTKVGNGQAGDWREALDAWLQAVGEKHGHPALRAEVMEVFDAALQARYGVYRNGLPAAYGPIGTGWWRRWKPDDRCIVVFAVSWLIAWLIGVRLTR